MNSYPRDWIVWSFAAAVAVVIVATFTLVSTASASRASRTAEQGWTTPTVELI